MLDFPWPPPSDQNPDYPKLYSLAHACEINAGQQASPRMCSVPVAQCMGAGGNFLLDQRHTAPIILKATFIFLIVQEGHKAVEWLPEGEAATKRQKVA